ncbi:MAG: Ig-like domain-containing protein [Gammaproteobacteria bacterium]
MILKHLFSLLALMGFPMVCLAATPAPHTINVTFTVNSVADSVDANPGDGICMDASGQCSLRAAVMEANALAGPDMIKFDSSTDGQPILLQLHGAGEDGALTGDLDITDDVTIDGSGYASTIIDGDAADRVFDVISGTLNLQHVTVQNGGAVAMGGGIRIRNGATLNLFNAHVTGNHATGSGVAYGGGIEADSGAFLGIDTSEISGNSAESSGSLAEGGGLDLEANNTVGIVFTDISNNTATSTGTSRANGGGIHSISLLTLQDSSVRDNTVHADQADGNGGGISIDVINGSLTLSRVEISGNTAEAPNGSSPGGAIVSASPVTLINTTVVNNKGDIAGIYQGTGLLTLVNTTISGNTGSSIGGVFVFSSASVNLADTLIAGNTGSSPDCDISGSATSYGYNLIGDTTDCTFATATGDQFGTASNPIDPKLGPLTTGGQIHTLPLLSDSPALDKGDPQLQSQGGTCQSTDQLGNTRPVDGNGNGTAVCDIGAVERGPDNAPQAQDGSLNTLQNTPATSALAATDADGDPLTFAVGAPPAHGTANITDPIAGTFTYTPNSGYSGADSFTFTATDGIDISSAGTESITVKASPSSGGGGGGGGGGFGLPALFILALMPWWLRHHRPIAARTAAPTEGDLPMKHDFRIHFLAAACAALIFGGVLTAVPALAAPGDVDITFNGGVPAVIDLNPSSELRAYNAAVNPINGDILWSGYIQTPVNQGGAITAYKPDGTLDTAVGGGSGEIELTADQAGVTGGTLYFYAIAVDDQGRILAAGIVSGSSGYAMALARFKPDGTLDTGFGAGGTGVVTDALNTAALGTGLSLTADGHILVTGIAANPAITEAQLTVWRFNPDGTTDTGYGDSGHVQLPDIANPGLTICLPALQPDGALIAGCTFTSGGSWKLTRLNPDGLVDTTFGSSGFVTGGNGLGLVGLALAPDGGFVVGEIDNSTSPPPIDLRRYLADGSVDSGFNGGNPLDFGTLPGPSSLLPLAAQPDDKILVTGSGGANSLVIARLLADGTLDSSFGNVSAGISAIDFNNIGVNNYTPGSTALMMQGDGKIVASGYADSSAGTNYAAFVTRVDNDAFTLVPDAFSFMDKTGVSLSTLITSNAISVSGLSSGASVPVSVRGGEYKINSGAWTSDPGMTTNGDQIAVRHTSSGSYSTQTTTTLTIGGQAIPNNNSTVLGNSVSDTFTSTTKAAPPPPPSGGGGGGFGILALLSLLLLAAVPMSRRRRS